MFLISIHALREEGDVIILCCPLSHDLFLSTPSARRATCLAARAARAATSFLSTPSARRATCRFLIVAQSAENFYPRPPRGGRRCTQPLVRFADGISIHALREEGDQRPPFDACPTNYFYPRPPRGGRHNATRFPVRGVTIFLSAPSARRATLPFGVAVDDQIISIHALREEGDLSSLMP